MIAVPIGPRLQRLALAAAPSYLEERGTPNHPRDLLNHDCIRLRFSSGAIVDWEFQRGGETVNINPKGRMVIGVDAAPAAIDLACRGHGVIATFENYLIKSFETGGLVPVLQEWWLPFEGPWLYFSSRFMPAPLRAFVDLVAQER
jgi:DNA-binding transcriptional LysR family regulator